ncbi:MAG TPA: multicopper oxidase domain-containing protein, partial [Acidobacteriaceae bacterium]|nr:multicopper oxidase domain-containing protein [Acidobacteriaceae bacterium]
PSVRIRMDFRDPNIVGIFPYHCHILEHEDKGMMGTIEVLAQKSGSETAKACTGSSRDADTCGNVARTK